MSGGCNQAQKMQKLVAELVIEDYNNQVGPAVWDSMTAEEQSAAVRMNIATCQKHLRNTMLRWGIKGEKKFLEEILDEPLGDFSSEDRTS